MLELPAKFAQMEETPSFAECNPCYVSNLGPNPHYAYKAPKTVPNYATDGPPTTDWKGPVTKDSEVRWPTGLPMLEIPAAAAKFAQVGDDDSSEERCNPCYNSSLGPNPHWPYKAAKTVANNGFDGPPTTDWKGPVTKDEEVRWPAGLPKLELPAKFAQTEDSPSLAECNPCYNSSQGPNPHYAWKENAKAIPNNGHDPKVTTTDWKGPVT